MIGIPVMFKALQPLPNTTPSSSVLYEIYVEPNPESLRSSRYHGPPFSTTFHEAVLQENWFYHA